MGDKITIDNSPLPKQANIPPQRFDHALYEAMEKGGAFLGEMHDRPGMRQAVGYLLPALKSRNLALISLEMKQSVIDEMIKAPSTEAWLQIQTGIPKNYHPAYYCDLVRTAHQQGIHVTGHEDPSVDDFGKQLAQCLKKYPREEKFFQKTLVEMKAKNPDISNDATFALIQKTHGQSTDPEFKKELVTIIKETSPVNAEGIKRRNIRSAERIKAYMKEQKIEGGILVLGGSEHGNGVIDDGKQEGLDVRLNIRPILVRIYDTEQEKNRHHDHQHQPRWQRRAPRGASRRLAKNDERPARQYLAPTGRRAHIAATGT